MTEHEKNLARAEARHDLHTSRVMSLWDSTIQFSLEALRIAAIVNGGAVVAGIAFVGAVYNTKATLAESLMLPIMAFAAAAASVGVAAGFAYFSQFSFTAAASNYEYTWEHPFVSDTCKSKVWQWIGNALQIVSILTVSAAYAALIYGCHLVYGAVMAARVAPA